MIIYGNERQKSEGVDGKARLRMRSTMRSLFLFFVDIKAADSIHTVVPQYQVLPSFI